MSGTGRLTSLELNVQGKLINNQGFVTNPDAVSYQGFWNNGAYAPGSLTTDTVLNKITLALPNFLANCVPSKLSVANWRTLLTIGSIDCPALGNSRPATFAPTYAGYGTWENKTVDAYGNITGTGALNLTVDSYPPFNYGKEETYSYIYQEHGSYAWLTGWPGKNAWQKDTDDFTAAYPPGLSDTGIIDYDTYFSQGFVATVARQAYYEFWYDYQTRRANQYPEFIRMIQRCNQWQNMSNKSISSFVNTKNFIRGNYSNINDLTTSDIAGVNLAFQDFGYDLINLGKSLDLSTIYLFGLPSKFILNLQATNALTDAVKLALLYSDLTTSELDNILTPTYAPSVTQENKLYTALTLIQGQDLADVKVILNCATDGLESLADLINPQKMFPNSYASLTIPEYNTETLSSKNYKFIYSGNGVNTDIANWGEYLVGILPAELALACGAFMMTMNQIKNIRQMEIEKISQVIDNLEVTNLGLPLINSTDATPGNVDVANSALELIAFGSGNGGTYRFCDFLGALSGWPYRDYYQQAQQLLSQVQTQNLANVYVKLYQKSLGNDWALLSSGSAAAAYKIYKTTAAAVIGNTVIPTTSDLTQVLIAGDIISFSSADSTSTPAVQYTVSSVTSTTVVITTGLTVDVDVDSYIFKYEPDYNTSVPLLVTAANNEIQGISATNSVLVQQLNYYWANIGRQLAIEQRAIALCLIKSENITAELDKSEFDMFMQSLSDFARKTQYCEIGPILEAIADLTTLGGQSLVASMREARNAQRIMNAGGEVDNDVPDQLDSQAAMARAVVVNGAITTVEVLSGGSGYGEGCDCCAPVVMVYPQGGVFGGQGAGATLTAIMDDLGSVKEIEITNPGRGYSDTNPPMIMIMPPPVPTRLGLAVALGSFAGSPYAGISQEPVPDNLLSLPESSYTVAEARNAVVAGNCDC